MKAAVSLASDICMHSALCSDEEYWKNFLVTLLDSGSWSLVSSSELQSGSRSKIAPGCCTGNVATLLCKWDAMFNRFECCNTLIQSQGRTLCHDIQIAVAAMTVCSLPNVQETFKHIANVSHSPQVQAVQDGCQQERLS